jgi:hypothetical protein
MLPLQSQYIFPLLLFVAKKRNYFIANTDSNDTDTCYNYNLYLPSTNLSIVQKGVLFSGSKIYNQLPLNIKLLSKDIKVFKSSLRSFLIENIFTALMNIVILLLKEYLLFRNHWNMVVMNIIIYFLMNM